MDWLKILFWISVVIVLYTYLGYGLIIYLWVQLKRLCRSSNIQSADVFEPEVTIVIPCFNEAEVIENKIANCRILAYPTNMLKIIFITDGSTDNSKEAIQSHNDILLLHENLRAGKAAAQNRAMRFVTSPIVIFSDANTFLNPNAIRNMVKHFANPEIGCVSGEKRIWTNDSDSASAAGEGIYWKYESKLKQIDSLFNSAVGAAGELVAFRTNLYTNLQNDTLLDDFMQSMLIAAAGYKIVYEVEAYTMETASHTMGDELKRKIRISTGTWQSMQRLHGILKCTKTPLLFFQYISHKVLRWTMAPFLVILMLCCSIKLSIDGSLFYRIILWMQLAFYTIAFSGYLLKNKKTHFPILFVPYYFCMMNYAVFAGLKNFLSMKPTGIWEKSERKAI